MSILRCVVRSSTDRNIFLVVLAASDLQLFPYLCLCDLRIVDRHPCLLVHKTLYHRDSGALASIGCVFLVCKTEDANFLVAYVVVEASNDSLGEAIFLPDRLLAESLLGKFKTHTIR